MVATATKIGRNDLCHCGSNIKYKKCCLPNNATHSQLDHISSSFEALKKKTKALIKNEAVFIEKHPGKKMSECILDLCEDIMDGAKTKKELTTLVGLACFAWNVEIISHEKGIDDEINLLIKKMVDDKRRDEAIEFVKLVIKRKKALYPDNKRLIMNYELVGNKRKGFQLNVASTAPDQNAADLGL